MGNRASTAKPRTVKTKQTRAEVPRPPDPHNAGARMAPAEAARGRNPASKDASGGHRPRGAGTPYRARLSSEGATPSAVPMSVDVRQLHKLTM